MGQQKVVITFEMLYDFLGFLSKSVNEVVFWYDKDETVDEVTLTAIVPAVGGGVSLLRHVASKEDFETWMNGSKPKPVTVYEGRVDIYT